MKNKTLTIIIFVSLLLVTFMPASIVVFFAEPQYEDTFYGEFTPMLEKLETTEDKKIVIVGNSAVAFGVDSALLETELAHVGLDYTVCNYGLYGALGTKFMMDTAFPHVNEGDIVILSPEPTKQCMSLYFSGKEIWRAVDGNFKTLRFVKGDDKGNIAGTLFPFAVEKFKYLRGRKPEGSGVYSADSFDKNCDLKKAKREYNIMPEGYDTDNLDLCDSSFLDDEFIDYVNDFAQRVRQKGAKIMFAFTPLNQSAVEAVGMEQVEEYFSILQSELRVRMLNSPTNFIYPKEWFYDSNVHLNSAGMTLNTINLADAIKLRFKITEPCVTEIPATPQAPEKEEIFVGDDSDADLFTYEEKNGNYVITGLSEKGKTATELTVPTTYNGKQIKSFTANVFKNDAVVEKIVIQKNISRIFDKSFVGCLNLTTIVVRHESPTEISVGMSLLEDCPDAKIYVPDESIGKYVANYFWSKYANRTEAWSNETK